MKVTGRTKKVNHPGEEPSLINVFGQSPIAIELYNTDGKLLEANQASLNLFGIGSIKDIEDLNLFENPNITDQSKTDIRSGKTVRLEFEFDFDLAKSRELRTSTRSGTSILQYIITPAFTNEEIKGYISTIFELPKPSQSAEIHNVKGINYRSIFDFISDAICILDISDKKIDDVNNAMVEMFGLKSKEAITGKDFGDLIANIKPYDRLTAEKLIQNTRNTGPQSVEWLATRVDGCGFWIEMTLTKMDIGGSGRILVVGRDITEHKRTEQILIESENKYRSLIQYSSDPIFSFNPDETYRFINEAFSKPFAMKPEDIIGKTPYDIFSHDEATKRLATVREVFKTKKKSEIEVKVDTKSGEVRYYLTMADPIMNDSGQVLYVTCVSKDITDRKRAENALKESRERYKDLTELAVDGILIGTEEGVIIDANSCICAMSGRSREELIGLQISNSIFSPESIKKTPFRFDQLLKGDIVISERNILRPDGSEITVEMRTKMMPDKTYQTIIRDITERKKVELLLKEQADKLKELNSTKDKFMSIIAHDLKNPFNAILGFSDLMLSQFHQLDDETLLKGLRTIESASSHAYKLLENLLIWSQNQTGLMKFNPEMLNLKTQLNELLSTVENTAINKRIKIIIKIEKSKNIYADKNMIDSILRNLISNAIKFSYPEGKINISATEIGNHMHISVTDNGIGITPDRISAIFKIDKRTNTLGTENEQGTGLGLILCKEFVNRHKGDIWVKSIPGKGSTFTFSLPLKQV